jgi:hypothetical protein
LNLKKHKDTVVVMNKDNEDFAEIIESSLYQWLAQSWNWNAFPVFGSLVIVKAKDRVLFGIVHHIKTGSMDPIRYPFAYRKTEQELLQEQPQIFEFLKTTFDCICIGYMENNEVIYALSPEPPRIHSFVGIPSDSLSKKFLANHAYLYLIFSACAHIANIDELLLAFLVYQKKLGLIDTMVIQLFIEQYSLLTGNDYFRLKFFLKRTQHVLNI